MYSSTLSTTSELDVVGGQPHAPAASTPGKDPVSIVQGGPQGRSGRAENRVPTEIRSRTIQSVRQSLYQLSYPAQQSRE